MNFTNGMVLMLILHLVRTLLQVFSYNNCYLGSAKTGIKYSYHLRIRTEERGREVVKESIRDYLGEQFETLYRECDLIFTDHYRCDGYGNYSADVTQTIDRMMREEGIPMDTTYVGKAFTGMLQYLKDNRITDQKLLFIHTGGTPLFFDRLGKEENAE